MIISITNSNSHHIKIFPNIIKNYRHGLFVLHLFTQPVCPFGFRFLMQFQPQLLSNLPLKCLFIYFYFFNVWNLGNLSSYKSLSFLACREIGLASMVFPMPPIPYTPKMLTSGSLTAFCKFIRVDALDSKAS